MNFFVNVAPNLGINTYKVNEVITFEMNFMILIIESCKHQRSIKFIETHMEKIDKPNWPILIYRT